MTVRIKLKNGLYATIKRLDDPNSKPAADALRKRFYCSSFAARLYHVVSIRVKKELDHIHAFAFHLNLDREQLLPVEVFLVDLP